MQPNQTPACPWQLRSAVWEITLACSFSCAYCGSRAGKARENELSTEECLDLAGQLAALGCRRVSLIGGEVFMRPDWRTIVARLIAHGIRVCIITNGFVLFEETVAALVELGVESVAVSLDGLASVHDTFRHAGSHDRAVKTIQCLTDANIPVSVISTLNASNAQPSHLEAFYQELSTLPIFAWQLQACSPMGNAHASKNCTNSPLDYRFDAAEVIAFIERHVMDAPFAMGTADNIGYYTATEPILRGNRHGGKPFAGCRAGLSTLGIDSVGNVRGCESMYDDAFIEGNVRETPLASIWENPGSFAYNRKFSLDQLQGNCAGCPEGSRCAAGCRSYNFFAGESLYESPSCARHSL